MVRRFAIAAFALASLASPAAAQSADPQGRFDPPIPDEVVSGMSNAVLANMQRLQCGSDRCAPATRAEQAQGLLPKSEVREIIRKGMVSQIGACAGMDWERIGFRPMMADYRERRKASPRQLAYIAALHGTSMGATLSSLGGSCPERAPGPGPR
jgi:hypothetical protein